MHLFDAFYLNSVLYRNQFLYFENTKISSLIISKLLRSIKEKIISLSVLKINIIVQYLNNFQPLYMFVYYGLILDRYNEVRFFQKKSWREHMPCSPFRMSLYTHYIL